MKYKDGEYYYFPCRSYYAIYKWHEGNDGHGSGDKLVDNLSKENVQLKQIKEKKTQKRTMILYDGKKNN